MVKGNTLNHARAVVLGALSLFSCMATVVSAEQGLVDEGTIGASSSNGLAKCLTGLQTNSWDGWPDGTKVVRSFAGYTPGYTGIYHYVQPDLIYELGHGGTLLTRKQIVNGKETVQSFTLEGQYPTIPKRDSDNGVVGLSTRTVGGKEYRCIERKRQNMCPGFVAVYTSHLSPDMPGHLVEEVIEFRSLSSSSNAPGLPMITHEFVKQVLFQTPPNTLLEAIPQTARTRFAKRLRSSVGFQRKMTETDYMKLHERILAHPGRRYLQALQAYSTSKNILSGNAFQLRKLLEVVENPAQAADLWAMQNRKRFSDLQTETIRHFHNFLASVKTVVDHTRVMMEETYIAQAHRQEYRDKVMQVFGNDPLSRFVQDFRNYALHRGIPITGFEFSWSQGKDVASTVYLDLNQMEDWEGWKPLSRDFISNNKPKLAMTTLLDQYEQKAKEFHDWFCLQFQKHYEHEIDEVLALQRQWNRGLEEKPTDPPKPFKADID